MASISSLGVGSNIDLQAMLTKLMAAESVPLTTIGKKITGINSKVSVYGTVQSKLDTLRTAAQTLQFPSKLSAVKATTSNASAVTVTATSSATLGQYALEVTQLATAQKNVSSAYDSGSTFSAGTLTFSIAGDATTHDISVDGGDTLAQIGAKINAANLGITASVIAGTAGDRLVLTGTESGAANTFSFTSSGVTATPSGATLETKDVALSVDAKNALMTVDGIEVSSSTNTFSSAISGLSFTALAEGTANVNVATDSDKIVSAVQSFVDAYNDVVSYLKTNSTYDATTKTGQALSGDSTVSSILSALNTTRTTMPSELSSATLKSLTDLGVGINSSGQMTLDTSKLSTAISTSASDVNTAINAFGRTFSESVNNLLSSSGAVSIRVNSLNSLLKITTENQSDLAARIANIEKRYRAQFTALDTLVNSLTTTSTYLTQQFAALTNSSS